MNRKVYKGLVFMFEVYPSVICVWVLGDFNCRTKYSGYSVNEAIHAHYERVKGQY